MKFKHVLIAALLVLGWYIYSNRADAFTSSKSAPAHGPRTKHPAGSVGGSANQTAAGKPTSSRPSGPTLAELQIAERDKENQRRKALAEKAAQLSAEREAREAKYAEAVAAYDAQRKSLAEQIDELNRSGKGGPKADELDRKRRNLRPPERP
jgi:hypothetical protein